MNWITALRPQADAGLLFVARASQSLAIASMDRAMAVSRKHPLVPTESLTRVSTEVGGRLVGDPAKFVDDAYTVAQTLVDLHREFAQRLLDVLDTRPAENMESRDHVSGLVLPIPTRLAKTAR